MEETGTNAVGPENLSDDPAQPAQPIGRNWSADELTRILLLANEHQARMVADEIHGDLTLAPGEDYTPVLSLPRSLTVSVVMLMSPSKTFSEPGIQAALALAPDPLIRRLVGNGFSATHIATSPASRPPREPSPATRREHGGTRG
ncbi:MAG: aminotransferase class I/II-fold pyridoxal phosphate-dependent enzyme [Aeriscardovia sp.]|nr:aminotransferase class I/II-fold pyridoxal phosphate-dependent enzyme [Aeriscardovia sp.]